MHLHCVMFALCAAMVTYTRDGMLCIDMKLHAYSKVQAFNHGTGRQWQKYKLI